jgi:AmmeMemoRadiSam system protein A
VVGYAAAVFYGARSSHGSDQKTTVGVTLGLNHDDKARLLKIARKSIESRLTGTAPPAQSGLSPVLTEDRGAFVTLKKNGALRGCVGSCEARGPLYRTVEEMARSAAFHDPRFPSLSLEELDDVTIEISVLTPLRRIAGIDEIEVGTHGIYIVRGFYRGVLLPQVATEHSWDKITFLEETCHKAGLPANAWKDSETEIYIFSADIFGEDEE